MVTEAWEHPQTKIFLMGTQFGLPSQVAGKDRSLAKRRRKHYRHRLASLAHVCLDHTGGGIIRNLSESGLAIQAVGRLHADQIVHLRFELLKPRVHVEATGQVSWANSAGQAGLRFMDLPRRTQQSLKNWLLTDLLLAACELAPARTSIFDGQALCCDGLIVSSKPVTTIQLATQSPPVGGSAENHAEPEEMASAELRLRFSWWPVVIAARTFARFVDGLVLLSAVLLFAVIVVEIIGVVPSWLAVVGMGLGAGCLFALTYWGLFTSLIGTTLGRHLASLAAQDIYPGAVAEDVARFR